jgi:hypothetical protein
VEIVSALVALLTEGLEEDEARAERRCLEARLVELEHAYGRQRLH